MTSARVIIRSVLIISVLLLVIDAGARPRKQPFTLLWEAISNLQAQIDELNRPDLVAARLSVGSDDFEFDGARPRLVVRDETREVSTAAFLKYSNAFSNHMTQGRARGSIANPEDISASDAEAAVRALLGDDMEDVAGYLASEEDFDDEEVSTNLFAALQKMTVMQKIKLARAGGKEALASPSSDRLAWATPRPAQWRDPATW